MGENTPRARRSHGGTRVAASSPPSARPTRAMSARVDRAGLTGRCHSWSRARGSVPSVTRPSATSSVYEYECGWSGSPSTSPALPASARGQKRSPKIAARVAPGPMKSLPATVAWARAHYAPRARAAA